MNAGKPNPFLGRAKDELLAASARTAMCSPARDTIVVTEGDNQRLPNLTAALLRADQVIQ